MSTTQTQAATTKAATGSTGSAASSAQFKGEVNSAKENAASTGSKSGSTASANTNEATTSLNQGKRDIDKGAQLVSPPDQSAPTSEGDKAPPKPYLVQKGDNLTHIAKKHDVKLTELVDANPIFARGRDINLIYAGETLNLPAQSPSSATKNTADPKCETPKVEAPKVETPKVETPKAETQKTAPPQTEAPKSQAAQKSDTPKSDIPKNGAPKSDTPKQDARKSDKAPSASGAPLTSTTYAQGGSGAASDKAHVDDFKISAKGLEGSTSDPVLSQFGITRLAAMRRLADRGDATGAGKPDGNVDTKEAQTYFSEQKAILTKEGKAGPDKTVFNASEQKEILTQAQKNHVEPKGDAGTKALFNEAVASFSSAPGAGKDPTLGTPTNNAKAGDFFSSAILPVMTNGSLGSMFAFDSPTSVALKAFTPNWVPDIPFKKAADGKSVPMKGDWAPKDMKDPNGKTQYNVFQNTLKLHGWAAVRGEASLSRTTVGRDGAQLRTGTFSISGVVQQEVVGEANRKKGDFRNLNTLAEGQHLQYQVTTKPERLKDIMTGKIPAPNPYTLENMKPGDTVTITTGPMTTVEIEGRVMPGKGPLRAGLDVKYDHANQYGERIVVRMLPNTEKPKQVPGQAAQEPQRHVLIFKGDASQASDALAVGGIWNPKLNKDRKGGVANPLQNGNGAFVRVVMQGREVRIHNTFNFVEVNVDDFSKGGGRDKFREIVQLGQMPVGQTGQHVSGTLAHGSLDYKDLQRHSALIGLGYFEAGSDKFYEAFKGLQGTAGGQIDLFSQFNPQRDLFVKHQMPKGAINPDSSVYHMDAVNTEVNFGSGTRKSTEILVNGGNTQFTTETQKNYGTGEVSKDYWHTGANSLKANVVSMMEKDIADQKGGKLPLFDSFKVNTPSGPLQGQAALDYLKTHHAPKDTGWLSWLSPDVDKVSVRIRTKDDADRTKFAEYISADSKAHFEKNTAYYALTGQDQANQFVFGRLLGMETSPANLINLAGHSSKDFIQQFRTMSGESLSAFLYDLHQFRESAGANRSYPLQVEIDVKY